MQSVSATTRNCVGSARLQIAQHEQQQQQQKSFPFR